MQYVDHLGRNVRLGKKLGEGGEGAAFEVEGAPDVVAKIYHKPADSEKAEKLAAMSRLVTPEILRFSAWPQSTLHRTQSGPTVGIVMPRIPNAREVHELYSPAHRKLHFPKANWQFLIRVARNCAAAFSALHDRNIVIGDVNQGNLFVSTKAMVSLIDCDSFQILGNGRYFRCLVGVPHFTPPELQSARLSDVTRTTNHDSFGLAVMIFHLLFMGRHPFAGRYGGHGDMPIEKAISEFRFAYSSSAARFQMAPPPNSLTLGGIPPSLAHLFEQAFGRGSEQAGARPKAIAWAQSLAQLETQLKKCPDDPGHTYSSHLAKCPWCEVIRVGGPNFFIAVSIQSFIARSATFDLAAIWRQIASIPPPDQTFAPVAQFSTSAIVGRSIPSTLDDTRNARNIVGLIAVASGAITPVAMLVTHGAAFSVTMCIACTAVWLILKSMSPIGKVKRQRQSAYRMASQELDKYIAHKQSLAQQFRSQFQMKVEYLRQLKQTHEGIKIERDAEIQRLTSQIRERQLDDHLRRFFISDASISGIGPARISTLESYGIETAFDVNESDILDVPGFGESLTYRLLAWREQKERDFRFNPAVGVPQADLQALEMKYAQKRAQCERLLLQGPQELRQVSNAAKAEVEQFDVTIARLEFQVAQARADVRVLDKSPWWY